MLVIGGGATGVQVASIFNAFGSRVELFETGPRILSAEDRDVAATVATAFREAGIAVHEDFGAIASFEKTSAGVRMNFSKNGTRDCAEGALAIVAAGWVADTSQLNLGAAGVLTDHRGFVKVDDHLQDFGAPYFCRRRCDRSPNAGSACHAGRFRGGYQRPSGATIRLEEGVNTSAGFTDPSTQARA